MKREESPQVAVSTLVLPLLIFLLTSSVQSRTLQQAFCSSSCGDINNISYPFRLNTDPPGCGDTDYELSCQNNKTLLEFHSGKYYVNQISYDKHVIRVVDVNLADGSCRLPYQSVSVDEVMDDSRYRGIVSNTYTSFIWCSTNLSDQAYRIVPCLSRSGSYVYVSYGTYIISDLHGSCSFISRVPTIYQPVMYPSYDSILKLMQSGFDLGWSVECRDCVAAGASCTLSSWDTPFIYECYKPGFHVSALIAFIFSAIWNILLGINLIARFILSPIVIIGFLIHKYKKTQRNDNNEGLQLSRQNLVPRRYSYADLVALTNHFKDKLGEGGYGTVYKGQIPGGCFVAVKMMVNSKFNDEDFTNEVSIIGRIHHVNVVQLLGFCSEGSHRALVYEYLPNGSLDKYLSTEEELQKFSWEKLLQIALGTARAIEHLHGGCHVSILHFDIKPQNILLDQTFTPKVADFGLARFFPKDHGFVSINTARGTMGYIAPELLSGNLNAVSSKSDVYSFGMLLLEMVRRRTTVNAKGTGSSLIYFPSWIYDHLNEGGDMELENVSELEAAIARKLCIVGLWCVQKMALDRPSMSSVVEMLDSNIASLQLPPNSLSFHHDSSKVFESDSSTELLISETVEQSS